MYMDKRLNGTVKATIRCSYCVHYNQAMGTIRTPPSIQSADELTEQLKNKF